MKTTKPVTYNLQGTENYKNHFISGGGAKTCSKKYYLLFFEQQFQYELSKGKRQWSLSINIKLNHVRVQYIDRKFDETVITECNKKHSLAGERNLFKICFSVFL